MMRLDSVNEDLKRKMRIIAEVRNNTLHKMVNDAVQEWYEEHKVELQKEVESFLKRVEKN